MLIRLTIIVKYMEMIGDFQDFDGKQPMGDNQFSFCGRHSNLFYLHKGDDRYDEELWIDDSHADSNYVAG